PAPTNVTAARLGLLPLIDVKWDAALEESAEFTVEQSTDNGKTWSDSNASVEFDAGKGKCEVNVPDDATYVFRIRATQDGVDSSPSASSNAVEIPFAAPLNLVADALTGGSVTLRWTDLSVVENRFDIYAIGSKGNFLKIGEVGISPGWEKQITYNVTG